MKKFELIGSKRQNQDGRPKARRKWIAIVACVLLVVAVLAIIMPLPINIDTHAVEIIFSDDSHIEARTVRIRGWFTFNVFSRWHDFRGTIEILEYPETNSDFVFTPLRFQPTLVDDGLWGFRSAMLEYVSGLEPITSPFTGAELHDITTFGVIYATPFFRQAMVVIADDNDTMSLRESRVVVLNATTREEALEVILSSIIETNSISTGL